MGVISKLKNFRASTQTATSELNANLAELREKLCELRADYERTERLPVPRAEALAALDRDFDRIVANALRDFPTGALVYSNSPALPNLKPEVMNGLSLGANRDKARALIETKIAAHYEDGDGISAEDRAKKLAEIDAEIEEVERAEEALIRTAEAAGLPILRRADADPVALLLSDRALGL